MIYVDDLKSYPQKKKTWCHMATDGERDELHAFAEQIGLECHWFQNGRLPHYDLVESKRDLAIEHGATQVNSQKLFRRCYKDLVRKRVESISVAWYHESHRLAMGDQLGMRVRFMRSHDGGRARDRYPTPSRMRSLLELAWNYEFKSYAMKGLKRISIQLRKKSVLPNNE